MKGGIKEMELGEKRGKGGRFGGGGEANLTIMD
jgi:hypothetical protein